METLKISHYLYGEEDLQQGKSQLIMALVPHKGHQPSLNSASDSCRDKCSEMHGIERNLLIFQQQGLISNISPNSFISLAIGNSSRFYKQNVTFVT